MTRLLPFAPDPPPQVLATGLGAAINARIAARYDDLMREGDGHYATMFRVMQEIADSLANDDEPPKPKPAPNGPAPWVAPAGECRSCDRRRESNKATAQKKTKKASKKT